ncbi:MAG: PIN domain-containing protein [Jaaginema sp. PMC 1079.18]|nr:PIN domain-containing protein [Jaaginema sp. PMC 1080.18]MEC4853145.1 PIN domain-containing protein [Jaaginema sp. PMC 1079.18]MEC4868820.1 PIN domain-containing protein [Jaaginema sp. PMC 1078.18]
MNEYIRDVVDRYRNRGILVDTNILLLLFVGATNRDRIRQFSRTKQFAESDYDLLVALLNEFDKVITTPNILTEVSNWIGYLKEPERQLCFSIFAQGISSLEENYVKSSVICQASEFMGFGLTDCSIKEMARGKYLVLSDDLKLVNNLHSTGIDAINFNNLRNFS